MAKVRGFSCFSLYFLAFHALVFEDFDIKNYGHYFNIVALSCSILVNPNLTFFDVNNNFKFAIILHNVYFHIFFVSKWTNLTLIVLVNTLLIFKHETLTYFFIFIKIGAVVGDVLLTLILNLIFHRVSGLHWSCMSSHTLKSEGSWLQTLKDSVRCSFSCLNVCVFFTSDFFLFHVFSHVFCPP